MVTIFFAQIHPIDVYILLYNLYTHKSYTYLHTSTPVHLCMFTYFEAHIRPLHDYMLLRPYTYTCLHTCTPIYLYIITKCYALIPVHVYILLRPYIYIHFHTSMTIMPYICLQTSTLIYILYIFTYV